VVGVSEPLATTSADDRRRPAYGPGRVLIAVYAVFALSATARATVQIARDPSEAPLAHGLSALAALVYVVATVVLAHNGRRARRVAWGAVVVEMAGVLVVGALSLSRPDLFGDDTVWSRFGQGYGYVPLVLPVLGMVWLWRSSPARIVAAAERRDVAGPG
jgi:hypothetical protein